MMSMAEIRMLVKEHGGNPEVKEKPNTLETYQTLVGGYIEVVRRPFFPGDVIAIVDEEGVLKNRPANVLLPDGTLLAGTVVFVGGPLEKEDFVSLTQEEVDELTTALNGGDPELA